MQDSPGSSVAPVPESMSVLDSRNSDGSDRVSLATAGRGLHHAFAAQVAQVTGAQSASTLIPAGRVNKQTRLRLCAI